MSQESQALPAKEGGNGASVLRLSGKCSPPVREKLLHFRKAAGGEEFWVVDAQRSLGRGGVRHFRSGGQVGAGLVADYSVAVVSGFWFRDPPELPWVPVPLAIDLGERAALERGGLRAGVAFPSRDPLDVWGS